MIPIILKILSILGIFLLCLIGLLFIVILLVLFHPIFYKGKGSFYPEKKEFYFKAHWLFGLFHLEFHYPESTKILVKFICFTIYDSSLVKTAEEVEEDATGINPKEEDSMLDNMDMVFESLDVNEPPSEMNEEKVVIEQKEDNKEEINKSSFIHKIRNKIDNIICKIKSIYGNIKYIITHFKYYIKVLQEDETKLLFGKGQKALLHILKSIHPRIKYLDLEFGTGAPDVTGYIYGIICMFTPKLGKSISIVPNFQEIIFKGELYFKGHVTVFVLLRHGLLFLLDKRLKTFVTKMNAGGNK